MKNKFFIFALSLLPIFFSCSGSGSAKFKVTLTGTHCHFEKETDEAEKGHDYMIKAICDRGYSLTRDDISVDIGGTDPFMFCQFNEVENILFIDGSVVTNNITINAVANYGEYTCKIVANEEYYISPKSETKDITIEESTPDIDLKIETKEGYDSPKEDEISVTDGIEYKYKLGSDEFYHLEISHTQFYKNIEIIFPDLGK